jgi:uncharacterized membrane protein YcaP (DUF421 family)
MAFLDALIGPDKTQLLWWQETLQGLIIFAAGLLLIRASGLRTFSRFSPLDTVVTVLIGSNLSRAMTGSAPFVSTLLASLAIVVAHRALASAAFVSPGLNRLLNGSSRSLIVNGAPQPDALRSEAITPADLEEALRLRGKPATTAVRTATLERNGQISLEI